jgi:hypothetical protein
MGLGRALAHDKAMRGIGRPPARRDGRRHRLLGPRPLGGRSWIQPGGRSGGLLGLHCPAEALAVGPSADAISLSLLDAGGMTPHPNTEDLTEVKRLFVGESQLAGELIDSDLGSQILPSSYLRGPVRNLLGRRWNVQPGRKAADPRPSEEFPSRPYRHIPVRRHSSLSSRDQDRTHEAPSLHPCRSQLVEPVQKHFAEPLAQGIPIPDDQVTERTTRPPVRARCDPP